MITVQEAAKLVSGEVVGEAGVKITGLASPYHSGPGCLTFAVVPEQLEAAKNGPASCVMTNMDVSGYPKPVIKVKDIKLSLTVIYNAFLKIMPRPKGGIHPRAVISGTAKVGANAGIGANAVIGERADIGKDVTIGNNTVIGDDVRIGEGTRIYDNVTIYYGSVIGRNTIIHSGAVIGADGFGFITRPDGIYKVPQMGVAVIGDNVEIGANSCVDRGTFDNTVVGDNVKLDNLVQIAHNVKMGKNVFIAAQSGIAGSSTVGDNVMMGGQSGISDHLKIGNNVQIGAKSAVIKHNVKDGSIIWGYPARDVKLFLKETAFLILLAKKKREIMKLLRGVSGADSGEEKDEA
jgi:UDP-3-O-[3-hydroxymyristoyl] glucosamine N-acyltransferase